MQEAAQTIEKLTSLMIAFAIVMAFLLIPGSKIILAVSFFALVLFYLLFGFAVFNPIGSGNNSPKKKITALRIIGGIITGIGLSITCIGIMFKLLCIQASGIFLLFGSLVNFSLLIIVTAKILKYKDDYYSTIIKRLLIVGVLGVSFFFISTFKFQSILLRDCPAYIEAYKEYLKDPDNVELKKLLFKKCADKPCNRKFSE